MVKQRMSTADVAGETACLRQKLLGMRVANIYDVNPKVRVSRPTVCMTVTAEKRCFVLPMLCVLVIHKLPRHSVAYLMGWYQCQALNYAIHELQTYIIKLSRSGEEGEKAHLVLESGTRFHTTQVREPC